MDNAELKAALLSKNPVIYKSNGNGESEYKCVSAIVLRAKNGRIVVSAEIADKCGRSVTICNPENLRYKGQDEK